MTSGYILEQKGTFLATSYSMDEYGNRSASEKVKRRLRRTKTAYEETEYGVNPRTDR